MSKTGFGDMRLAQLGEGTSLLVSVRPLMWLAANYA